MLDRLWQMSYDSSTIDIMRNSKYAIPLIQSVHLIGITLLLGTTVIFTLRILNLGLRQIELKVLVSQLWKWAIGGLIITVASGFFVFLPDPARYAANTAFVTKMSLLAIATIFQFTLYRKTLRAPDVTGGSKVIALVALTLWFTIGWAGRAIAFLG